MKTFFGWLLWGVEKRVTLRANRVAWFLTTGKWPKPFACHKCDNPMCVRFSHLFEGTHKKNMEDMAKKGRCKGIPPRMFGEDNWNTKLTEEDVKRIRSSVDSQRALGRRFDVSQATIQRIKTRKVWRHV
jgi:hypothetical protein